MRDVQDRRDDVGPSLPGDVPHQVSIGVPGDGGETLHPPVSRTRIYPDNHFSAAVSFMVAEQFSDSIQMDAITRASKYGRMTGEFCYDQPVSWSH